MISGKILRGAVAFAAPFVASTLGSASAWAAPAACADKEVVGIVKDGFDTVQQYELKSKRRIAAIDGITDRGVAEHKKVVDKYDISRFCQAKARLADGETIDVWFRVYSIKAGKDGSYGAVRPCFSKYNPAHIGECSRDDAVVKP
jgi:hypothetical protein